MSLIISSGAERVLEEIAIVAIAAWAALVAMVATVALACYR